MPKTVLTSFCVLSMIWLTFAFYVSGIIAIQPLWLALLYTLILAVPIFMAGMYSLTIKKIQHAEIFHQQGVLYRLMTGRFIAYICWTLWSLLSAFLILFYLSSASQVEWGVVFFSLPVFILIYRFNSRIFTRELKSYIAVHFSLLSSRVMFTFTMALVNVFLQMLQAEPAVLEASQFSKVSLDAGNSSVLITETLRLLEYIESIKKNALAHVFTLHGIFYAVLVFIGSTVFFFNLGLVFSSFMLPAGEYRRLFSPLKNTEQAQAVSPGIVVRATAIITFTLFFICMPAIAYLELWLKSNPQAVKQFHIQEERVAAVSVEILEKIGEEFYQIGTIAKVTQQQSSMLNQLDVSFADIGQQSDIGYQLMANNVDNYLDWYYSLVGEYTRIFALLNGEIETMMATQLQEQLMAGDAFASLEDSIQFALAEHEQLNEGYQGAIDEILQLNRVEPSADRVEVQAYLPLISVLTPPEHAGILNLETRLLISGATGAAVTGAIAAKVTAKVIGKGTIKLGAKALAKVVAGKAASTTGGVAVGAALGSFIPGLGTVVGGVIGGLLVGLSVEQLLLVLEESFSREAFKQQILDSIESARLEFQASLV